MLVCGKMYSFGLPGPFLFGLHCLGAGDRVQGLARARHVPGHQPPSTAPILIISKNVIHRHELYLYPCVTMTAMCKTSNCQTKKKKKVLLSHYVCDNSV